MKKFLVNSVVAKVLVLVVLLFLASVPLSMVEGLIGERGTMKQVAAEQLAGSYAHAQTLAGPLIVVPFTERWIELKRNDDGVVIDRIGRSASHVKLVYPERLRLQGELTPDKRYRGIFTVLFYNLKATIDGRLPWFDASTLRGQVEGSTLEVGTPFLALGMGDVRGLQGSPRLVLSGEGASFLPRIPGMSQDVWPFQGVHAPLPAAALEAWKKHQPMDFRLELGLTGQSRFGIVPLGDDTRAHIASTWPHPSFGGSFLAAQRAVTERGFEADWAVSSLATSARAQLDRITADAKPGSQAMPLDTFDVSLINPLDVYALTGRAVKYGMLFVALTLMAAFMFELLRHLKLHPVQYGLVGLAITLFFLLLLALSEKVEFGLAYFIATGACVLLLAVYFSAVLGHWRRGAALGTYVGLLYSALYGLLLSEDNALLLGSVLLFGLLALLMIATRKVDWYALSTPSASVAAGQ
jgi:inner membrane protein